MRVLLLLLLTVFSASLRLPAGPRRTRISRTQLALDVGATVPLILGTGVVIFAAFNLPDNKIDLTDRGIAVAKQKRRQERMASGEYKPRDTSGLDPYRFRLPIIDDDDEDLVDVESIGRKKGGGCG